MKILWFSRHAFPSPRGDKSQLLHIMIWMLHDGFRPLTGINFNACYVLTQRQFLRFPSPLGDKFQRQICDFCLFRRAFPSPHGDKFQRLSLNCSTKSLRFRPLTGINFNFVVLLMLAVIMFPSPHGDKFQRAAGRDDFLFKKGFRPLSGINFNGLAIKQFYQSRKAFPSPLGDKFQQNRG